MCFVTKYCYKIFQKKDTILILNNEKERMEKCLGFNEGSFKYLL